MATYVNNLRLKEIATGAESGTWGTSTNTNLELIADALGSGTEGITTNADTHTTTVADGAADEGRALFLKYTGTLDSACTITLAPNTINKLWFIENATSGSQNIIISQGSGANVTIGNGKVAIVFTDGAGSGAAVLNALTDLVVADSLQVAGPTLTVGDAAAEDTKVLFDGNAKDFYVGLDDSADKLVIGEGSTVGTNSILTITDDTVTVGDGAAVDTSIVFDGNAQDYYIALDDSADDLLIGLGSTVGTTPAISIDENLKVVMAADATVGDDLTLVSDASVLNFGVNSDVNLTHVHDTALSLNKDLRIAADDEMLVLGAGQDATISYTGTHLIVQPQVVGSGQFVVSTNTGSYPSLNAATVAIIQRNAATGNDVMLDLLAGNAGDSILNFSDDGYQGAGAITYDHTTPHMAFGVGENTEWMRCDAATGRNVSIGCTDAEQQLQVKDATYGVQIESSAATKNPAIVYETTDGIRWVNGVNIAEGGTDAFEFRAAGSVFALRLAYDGGVVMPNLPTSDPSVAGELWNDSGTVKISS